MQPDLTHLVTRVICGIYLTTGVGMLVGSVNMHKVVEEINQSVTLQLIAAATGVSVGVSLITYHNQWSYAWPVLITMIGWLALLGGLVMAIFPTILQFALRFMLPEKLQGVLMIIFGAVLCYLGWWA